MSGNSLAWTHPATAKTLEARAYVFVAVDHCSSDLAGPHASLSATYRRALEPVRMVVSRHMSGFGEGLPDGLFLKHDNGSNYISEGFQREVAFFGIERSRIRSCASLRATAWRSGASEP